MIHRYEDQTQIPASDRLLYFSFLDGIPEKTRPV
jgi:hypothetical protein